MTSVVLIHEENMDEPISYSMIMNSRVLRNDDKVIDLFKSSINDAIEISYTTGLPINLRRCGCPLLKDPENTCISYSLYEIVGMFESTRKFACGRHLRQVLKTFMFPGLAIVYKGRFRVEINTAMPYYYPSQEVFTRRMNSFIEQKSLKLPSFDISDVFKKLLPYGKSLTEITRKYVLLKKYTVDERSSNEDICCICHETMDDINSGRLKNCNHKIHVKCLQKMLDSRIHTCPLCRSEIKIEKIVKN